LPLPLELALALAGKLFCFPLLCGISHDYLENLCGRLILRCRYTTI